MLEIEPASGQQSLFEQLPWRDPLSGRPLTPVIAARTPSGIPITGALRVEGTDTAYPIVDSVARLTPELANRYRDWLHPLRLQPPDTADYTNSFQDENTVDSFGFQWGWNSAMRSEADLQWRISDRFQIDPAKFAGRLVIDAGAGAGDQSRWLLDHGASVISVDLSSAIDVVARKLRLRTGWVGVQGDITCLPFENASVDMVYCEGVIQHTRDSAMTVRELCRILKSGGTILATHYSQPRSWRARLRHNNIERLRRRLCRIDRYKLLLLTGHLAALAYVPVIGKLLRLSGTASYSELMPDFKTTWTNTFDTYGNHAYQRHVSPEEFWGYFAQIGDMEKSYANDTVIAARKLG